MKLKKANQLEDKIATLSTAPGCYIFRDHAGAVLYVGKAKRLRARVRSYFRRMHEHGVKTAELVRRIADVDTFVVRNEVEAFLLEANLIKQYQPPFNIRLRDDKSYPYVKVSRNPRAEVRIVRRVINDGSRYFGPYTDVRDLRHALNTVRRLYTVDAEFFEHRYADEKHEAMARDLEELLSGRGARVKARLTAVMNEASAAMAFERAARYRDALEALKALEGQKQTVQLQGGNYDAVAVAHDADYASAVRIEVRGGRVVHTEAHMLANAGHESETKLLRAALRAFYLDRTLNTPRGAPAQVFLPRAVKGREAIETVISDRVGRPVRLHIPQRGTKKQVIELAVRNARHRLDDELLLRRESADRAHSALYALQEALSLSRLPRRIVCFDIAHLQGTDVVASAVTFTNAEPDKSGYRKFRIRGDWGNDDFRSMNETVKRYFGGLEERQDQMPDLVVIDGGVGQLQYALKALREIDLSLDVCSLAEQDEEIYQPSSSDPIRLSRRNEGLKLLQRARDEAHRFANSYTRKLRSKRVNRTRLTEVPGIGPKRAQALLKHFGSLSGMIEASAEEIARVAVVPLRIAEDVLSMLRR